MRQKYPLKLRNLIVLSCLAFLISSYFNQAHAVLILKLTDDLNNSVTIADEGLGDDGAGAGLIVFNGDIPGSSFTINITTGVSKPVLGTPLEPRMDLNSLNISTTGGGGLTIELTDTDFLIPNLDYSAKFVATIGGVASGTISYESYMDANNAEFATTTSLTDSGDLGPGGFTTENIANTGPLGGTPYSLTQVIKINHLSAGSNTSFNASLQGHPIPEPATMLLFGSGLVCVGFWCRRRKGVRAVRA